MGAGRVVRANTTVPDESLVIGVPGTVRPLSAGNRKRLEAPTANYIRNAQRYRAAGLGLEIPPQ